jgi:hypothetical protein
MGMPSILTHLIDLSYIKKTEGNELIPQKRSGRRLGIVTSYSFSSSGLAQLLKHLNMICRISH